MVTAGISVPDAETGDVMTGRAEFRVLGRVAIVRSGTEIAVNTPMLRRMLAVLLARLLGRHGQPIRAEVFVEAMWDDPPRTAHKTLQVYVHRLRQILGDDARVEHHPSAGYSLIPAEATTVDAVDFRDLIRRAGGTSEAAVSVELYREALGRWHGPAFDGFEDVAPVQPAAERLDEERLQSLERCLELELQLGRHAEVGNEIAEAAQQHPFREALQAHLMLALYRNGRQAEALAVYRRTYDQLADELGIEPSAILQDLHARILRNDPGLWSHTGPGSQLNQLPMITRTFVGRGDERAAITGALTPADPGGPAVVSVSGMGGVGKTTLAVQVAARCLRTYADGCLFIDLRGTSTTPAEPMTVLGGFLRAIGVPPREVPTESGERLGLYRTLTAQKSLLIVLDNAASEAQVRPLLPGWQSSAVIITSRSPMPGLDSALAMELGLLSRDEGAELLRAIGGRSWLDADPATVDDLVTACAGLPLAVRVVAGRLAGERELTPRQLVELLRDHKRGLPELTVGDLDVQASLDLSYQPLSPDARALLHRLGITFQLDVTARTAQVLAGASKRSLVELVSAQLLTRSGDRYRLHDLVRLYAGTRARQHEDGADLDGSVRRMVQWYLHSALHASWTGLGTIPRRVTVGDSPADTMLFTDLAEAMRWCEEESDNLIAAVNEAAVRGWHEEAWKIAVALRNYFRVGFLMDQWQSVNVVAVASAEALGDKGAQGQVLESTGDALLQQHDNAAGRGYFERALELYREVDDRLGQGRCHIGLGNIADRLGDSTTAEKHYRFALSLCGDIPYYVMTMQLNLGTLYGRQRRYAEAIDAMEPVLRHALAEGSWEMACYAHHNIGECCLYVDRIAEAEEHARQQIRLAQQHKLPAREARGWELLGMVYAKQGKPEAVEMLRDVVERYERLGDPQAEKVRAQLRELPP